MPVQGRKFVIIGGAGMLSSAVSRALLGQAAADIVICDSFGDTAARKWANLPVDIDDIWAPDTLMANLDKSWREIAGVIVLADKAADTRDADALFDIHYHLPRRVWDYCVAKQRPMHWASSSHVYGTAASNQSYDPAEVAALQPVTAFGRAKLAFDVFAARQGAGPDTPPVTSGFRLSSLYGANEQHKGNWASLPVRALDHGRNNTALPLWSDSDELTRDWIHVDDAAATIAGLIVAQKSGFFDIGTGTATTTVQLVEAIEELTKSPLQRAQIEAPATGMHALTPADTSTAEAAGVAPTYRTLSQGLAQL